MDPPLCIPMFSSCAKPMQILPMLRHGGNIKIWRSIGWFFVSWGYTEKFPQNASTDIIKIRPQRWTSPERVMDSSVSRTSRPYKPPELQHTTPPHHTNAAGQKEIIAHCVFIMTCPWGDSTETTASRLPDLRLMWHVPHKDAPKASRTCGANALLKKWCVN